MANVVDQFLASKDGRAALAAFSQTMSNMADNFCAARGTPSATPTMAIAGAVPNGAIAYIPAAPSLAPSPMPPQSPCNPTSAMWHGANAYQNGFPGVGGSCCEGCKSGGGCSGGAGPGSCTTGACGGGSDGSTGQACSGDDRVWARWPIAPGFFNCEPDNGTLAPCQVDRVANTQRRFSAQGTSADTSLVEVLSDAFNDYVPQITGYSWYRLVIDPVGVSNDTCIRDLKLTLTDVTETTDVTDTIEAVTLQSEYIFQDGNGNYVRAWDWPRIAQAEDIRITDGRCACECLCVCTPARGRVGVAVLVPTLADGQVYVLTVRGLRNNWQKNCGYCPPELLCGRELIDE